MTDEDAPVEDWISSQAAVDSAIIYGSMFREDYGHLRRREATTLRSALMLRRGRRASAR